MAEWTEEVRVLNLEFNRGYAAEGKEGIWSSWASGFWITCFHMYGMKLGLIPDFSSSDFSSPASKIDRNGIVLRAICMILSVGGLR